MAHDPLHRVVKCLGETRQAHADVGDQARALSGDRGSNLRRLGDSLDQHLRLVGGEHLLPRLRRGLGSEHLPDDPGDLLGAEIGGECLILDGTVDRASHRRALQRTEDCLLDGLVDRRVDASGMGDALGTAGAGREQTRHRRLGMFVLNPGRSAWRGRRPPTHTACPRAVAHPPPA